MLVSIFRAWYKNIQNLQSSQAYIFHILQRFATKHCNFTNFRMLFNAVIINFPISTFFKILSTMQSVHLYSSLSFIVKTNHSQKTVSIGFIDWCLIGDQEILLIDDASNQTISRELKLWNNSRHACIVLSDETNENLIVIFCKDIAVSNAISNLNLTKFKYEFYWFIYIVNNRYIIILFTSDKVLKYS